jgi:hypothetical protein
MSKGLTVCPSSFRSYFLHRVRYPNLCVTGESYVVYRARQTGASHVRGPNHVPNAESIRRRTIKDTYPSRLEAEQEILFAEYECTLGKEVDLLPWYRSEEDLLCILPGDDFVDDGQLDCWTPGYLLVSPTAWVVGLVIALGDPGACVSSASARELQYNAHRAPADRASINLSQLHFG